MLPVSASDICTKILFQIKNYLVEVATIMPAAETIFMKRFS